MSETERKWPGKLIITNELIFCSKCRKKMKSGELARIKRDSREAVCEVCFSRLSSSGK